MKIAIIGAGTRVGQPGFAFLDELRHQGMVEGEDYILDPCSSDFEGDTMVLPRRVPEEHSWDCKRGKTGAARIKRAAKQKRRRKG